MCLHSNLHPFMVVASYETSAFVGNILFVAVISIYVIRKDESILFLLCRGNKAKIFK